MQSFSEGAMRFKLNKSDDWIRKRQDLALPILPPTTPEARKYFFSNMRKCALEASSDGSGKIDYLSFAQEWNKTADGKERFYITVEVLAAYAKTWEKATNAQASKELISEKLVGIEKSKEIFAASDTLFPDFLTGPPNIIQPSAGLISFDDSEHQLPESISTQASVSTVIRDPIIPEAFDEDYPMGSVEISHLPRVQSTSISQFFGPSSATMGDVSQPNTKRRRIIPADQRRRNMAACRRCKKTDCPGSSDLRRCPQPCIVPCTNCGRTENCRAVDGGRKAQCIDIKGTY
jgi:hypothetical protein